MPFIVSASVFAAFVLIMVLMHKFGYVCTGAPAVDTTTTTDEATQAKPAIDNNNTMALLNIPMFPIRRQESDVSSLGELTPRGEVDCATPSGAYAISVLDNAASSSPVARKSRAISYIRFSGFTRSDVTISDRSTGLSFWSALSSDAKESECSDATPVATPESPTKLADEVDTVEIEDFNGTFGRINMLAYKPAKPRALTTKNLKKHAQVPYIIV